MASAKDRGSGPATSPTAPWSRRSASAPHVDDATTGVPQASASSATLGSASNPDGSRQASAAASNSASSD